ncbi:hypothetical protein [Actinomadura chibensis]|uniref:hypothetical protein n=1 Tax=Actinomadura chibensis TaxID=392828 RepID=UPI000831771F|nr:hypothetical protein [Actinomadura chibensis]
MLASTTSVRSRRSSANASAAVSLPSRTVRPPAGRSSPAAAACDSTIACAARVSAPTPISTMWSRPE